MKQVVLKWYNKDSFPNFLATFLLMSHKYGIRKKIQYNVII